MFSVSWKLALVACVAPALLACSESSVSSQRGEPSEAASDNDEGDDPADGNDTGNADTNATSDDNASSAAIGSCDTHADNGLCVYYAKSQPPFDAAALQQSCVDDNGTYSAGACPAGAQRWGGCDNVNAGPFTTDTSFYDSEDYPTCEDAKEACSAMQAYGGTWTGAC